MSNLKIKLKKEWFNPKTEKYSCPYCKKEYSKKGICSHIWRSHTEKGTYHKPFKNKIGWNRGLTKDTDNRIYKQSITYKTNFKNGKFINPFKGKKHTKATKLLISKKNKRKVFKWMGSKMWKGTKV